MNMVSGPKESSFSAPTRGNIALWAEPVLPPLDSGRRCVTTPWTCRMLDQATRDAVLRS